MDITGNMVASLWLICTILSLAGAGHALYSAATVKRLRRRLLVRPAPEPATQRPGPPVSILKPLYGAEPDLARNLASFLDQIHEGRLQILLGVHTDDDPAAEVARRLIAERQARIGKAYEISLVVDPAIHGGNAKVSSLINMAARATGSVIILADSDIWAPPHYLRTILKALSRPGTGAVTCLYHGVAAGGWASRLTALGIDWHFLPNVLVGLRTGLAHPCMGSTIALTRDTLERIGGFQAFADKLADDYEIGRAVRALGLEIAVPDMVLGHSCSERTLAQTFRHELRWARTVRLIDPLGHAGSVITNPLPFALGAVPLDHGGAVSLMLLGLVLACRAAVQVQVQHVSGAGKAWLLLGPVRDLATFGVFLASWLPGRLDWRGIRFGVDGQGRMTGAGE